MAVPSVTNIYPNYAHAGGEALVRILGGGFQAPPDPTSTYVTRGAVYPTVEVLFDGVASPSVTVVNRALMYVVVPVSPLADAKTGSGAGTVAITVRNIDETGAAISSETVTVANAFTYRALKLTDASDLSRLVRAFIREMKRQIIPEVVYSPHTDYDADTGDQLNIVSTATLPALALIGPTLQENRFFSTNERAYVAGHGRQVRRRSPLTVDVRFSILGIGDKSLTTVNLQAAVLRFFDKNRYLHVLHDAADPSAGYASFEMGFDQGGAPSIAGAGDDANVRTFESRIVIKGFDIETLAGFDSLTDAAVGITDTVDDASYIVFSPTEQFA